MTTSEDRTVPPLGDGFASAGTRVPPPDAYSESDLDRGVDQAVAYAYPSLNLVEFHVDTAPGELEDVNPLDIEEGRWKALIRLLYTQIKALREELLHGTRSELGITRNVRLLDWRVQALVDELATLGDGETSGNPEKVVESLNNLVALRRALQDAQEVSVETVDKFHVDSLLTQEEEVLEDLLGQLAPHQLLAEDVRKLLEKQFKDEKKDYANDEQYDELIDLRDRASWRLAEATAQAAADVPFLVKEVVPAARAEGFDVEVFETVPADMVAETLGRRLSIALEVAETATEDVPADAPTRALKTQIREVVDRRTGQDGGERRPTDLWLPLLDIPARHEGDQFHGDSAGDARSLTETETAVGYFLAGAFRTVGDFGGAIYLTPDGDWQWAINPWVANEKVDIEIDGIDSYARLWAHAYVCYSIAEQFGDPPRRTVECPLCVRSRSGTCGPEDCDFAELIGGVNAAMMAGSRGVYES